jgi:UDP-N-acetyl-D-galactosamine dehydrogenase
MPEVILAGRRINDNMGHYVVSQVVKKMLRKRIHVEDSNVLILGLTFKENCPDIRNTRVVDIVHEFRDYGANVDVFDPWVNAAEAQHEYAITPVAEPAAGKYEAIILAVAHDQFKTLGIENIRKFGRRESVIYDIKSVLPRDQVDGRL